MRTIAQNNRARTTAALTAGVILVGGLPVLAATSAQAVDEPVVTTTQTAPAKPTLTKKQRKAMKLREKRKRQKQRANRARASLVRVGLNQLGEQYVAGAAGPNRFDCSGFTQYVYKKRHRQAPAALPGAQMNKARRVGARSTPEAGRPDVPLRPRWVGTSPCTSARARWCTPTPHRRAHRQHQQRLAGAAASPAPGASSRAEALPTRSGSSRDGPLSCVRQPALGRWGSAPDEPHPTRRTSARTW